MPYTYTELDLGVSQVCRKMCRKCVARCVTSVSQDVHLVKHPLFLMYPQIVYMQHFTEHFVEHISWNTFHGTLCGTHFVEHISWNTSQNIFCRTHFVEHFAEHFT